MPKSNMLQRALHRLASTNAELESEELQRNVRDEGAVPISTCQDREQVCLTGTVSAITLSPRRGRNVAVNSAPLLRARRPLELTPTGPAALSAVLSF